MIVLNIIGIIIGIIIFLGLLGALHYFYEEKFDYPFFSRLPLIVIGISSFLLYFGEKWRLSAIETQGDVLNGVILIIIGVAMFLFLCVINFIITGFLFGVITSILHLGLVIFVYSIALAVTWIAVTIIGIMIVGSILIPVHDVRVVN